jgi:PrlF antitoxin of toxin-antitoxin system YhaV/PrlF
MNESGASEDAILAKFLSLIDKHMAEHPESVQPLDPDWLARAQKLVADVPVGDLDEDLGDEAVIP